MQGVPELEAPGRIPLRILLIVLGVIAFGAVASTVAVYSYGRFAERSLGEPSYALPAGAGTPLDQTVAPMLAREGDRDGLVLLDNGYDAFAARVLATRTAGRSLDLMYYIWENDLTGRLLAAEVLRAADRGVRVRILLDDFTTHGSVAPYLALNSYENVEVRMFNPTRARENALQRGLEMILRLFSATRRMHNKAWIADARLAIVGGRNIGDDYFDATETDNFRDLDVLMVGPVVAETEAIFDAFWNSTVVLPITALARGRQQQPDLEAFRAAVGATSASEAARPYLDRVRERASMLQILVGPGSIHWTDSVEVYSDPPEKALGLDEDGWLIVTLLRIMSEAQKDLEIVSPYFVTGVNGTAELVGLAERGVDVRVLTNSLAATDAFPAGFSGYVNYRLALVEGGVQLFELRPEGERAVTDLLGASKLSLHTKAFTVDDNLGFVGSFNFDLRSAGLNTEMGVVFRDAGLVTILRELFRAQTRPDGSYRVTLAEDGTLRWEGDADGTMETYDRDPDTSPFRRFVVWFLSWLPIESQL